MTLGQRRPHLGRQGDHAAIAWQQFVALDEQPQRIGIIAPSHRLATLRNPAIARCPPGLLEQAGKVGMQWIQFLRSLQNAQGLFAVTLRQQCLPLCHQPGRLAPVLHGLQDALGLTPVIAVVQRRLCFGDRRLQIVLAESILRP